MAAVDTVGGATLAAALAQTKYRGALACPGVAGGGELSATVPAHLAGGCSASTRHSLGTSTATPRIARAGRRGEKLAMWEFCAEHLPPDALALTGGGTIDTSRQYAPRIIRVR